jgi:hypothetical protein
MDSCWLLRMVRMRYVEIHFLSPVFEKILMRNRSSVPT